jgi:DNA adenine methylase
VPFGRRKTPEFLDRPTLRACSAALNGVVLRSGDFSRTISDAKAGDLVYLDPPYVTGHNNNGFVEYNARLFLWCDQIRLAAVARSLVGRGVHVRVTNADHEGVRRLYGASFQAVTLMRHSTIAASAASRRVCGEVLLKGGS